MCNFFCWLLEEEVSNKVGELFGGSAKWLMFRPKISFLLASCGAPNQHLIAWHCVLWVQTGDGQEMIMDGTLRQYLWAKSTWLQTREEWEAKRVDESQNFGWVTDTIRNSMGKGDLSSAMGFWVVVHKRMTRLFEEIDWEELKRLEAG